MGSVWDFYLGYYEHPWVHPEIAQLERMFRTDVPPAPARLVERERPPSRFYEGALRRHGPHRRSGLWKVLTDNRAWLGGMMLGAVLALMFDSAAGHWLRALVRDKIVRRSRPARDRFNATAHDMTNWARGIVASLLSRCKKEVVGDARLHEQVLARLGRVCSHPHALDVEVSGGRVTLRGPILASEIENAVAAVGGVRGVRSVVCALEARDSVDGVPSLQDTGRVAGSPLDILQETRAPAVRALVGLAALAVGGLALAYARRRWRDPDSEGGESVPRPVNGYGRAVDKKLS